MFSRHRGCMLNHSGPTAASAFPSSRSRDIAWFCWMGAGRTDRPLRLSLAIAIAHWSWLPLVVVLASSMVFRADAIGPVLSALGGGDLDAMARQTVGEMAFFTAPIRHRALCQPPPSFGSGRNAQHPRLRDGVSGRGAVAMDGPLARVRARALHRRHHRVGSGAGGSPFPFRCVGGTHARGIGGKCGGTCLLVELMSIFVESPLSRWAPRGWRAVFLEIAAPKKSGRSH